MTDPINGTADTIPLIGQNHTYYSSKWQDHQKPSVYCGFNLAALLVTPFWLAYRHLYDWLIFYVLLQSVFVAGASFLPWLFYAAGLGADLVSSQLLFILTGFTLLHLGFGLKANALYYRRIQHLKNHGNASPLFYRSGASVKSGIITGLSALLFAVLVNVPLANWTYNPALEPGIYVFSDDNPVPEGVLDVRDEPDFVKYEARINLLFIHDEPIGDRSFRLLLERETDSGNGMAITRDRSFGIFSSSEVTLDLLDSEDPLTDTGTYHLTIFLDEEEIADTVFSISL
ncbi:DUF2628 domain-containing protein [Salisediminibacterium selenitireducens]|uniref:DUF2628 domain-containing protein n=1 Tax=Bacillus selenitireducens (strain ATCC 700615 / DSM 15326 / MLS10) TaxID=439292 RepID=D6XXI8_BACIE|nr:DUF2628 domain-containing protein [Salisediminibacterium selenitireducens]ADH98045.1 hypothetical protein Bsel_0509 [[Bacillus] selenitireducens MLS10]